MQVVATQASEAVERGEMLVIPNSQEVLTTVLGERSGYVRGRGYGPKPPPKSTVIAATMASFQSQLKAKDDRLMEMEQKMRTMREELRAEFNANMTAQVNELVKNNMAEIMSQFNGHSNSHQS